MKETHSMTMDIVANGHSIRGDMTVLGSTASPRHRWDGSLPLFSSNVHSVAGFHTEARMKIDKEIMVDVKASISSRD